MSRTSKKYSGCLWGQRVTAAGVADGPVFKLGNVYPLTLQMSVNSYDLTSAQCDTAGQILESRSEIDVISGEMAIYQYGATEIGWAVGAKPVALTGTGGTTTPASATAPAVGGWLETGKKNMTAFALTNAAGTTTYVAGTDYLANLHLGVWTIIAGGAISAAAEVKWSCTTAAPTGYQLDVGSSLQTYVRLFGSLKDIKSGGLVEFSAPCAGISSKNGFTVISEPKTEYEALEFDLKFITLPGQTTPCTLKGVPAE